MKKQILIMIAAMGLAVGTTAVSAQGFRGMGEGQRNAHGGGMKGAFQENLIERLDLTDEQEAELREKQYDMRLQMIDLQAEKQKAELELEQLMQEDTPDRKDIEEAIQELGSIDTEIRIRTVNMQLDVKNIVGAEKLEELKQETRDRLREHMKERGNRRSRQGGDRRYQRDNPPPPEEE